MSQPLIVEDLARRFQAGRRTVNAVDGVTFAMTEGELYTLLGPSGCGKTTTLRCVAGLEQPDGGTVSIDGTVVSGGDRGHFVPAHRRDIGMVFQSYGIWPHMTVFENAAFPLRVAGSRSPKRTLRERVDEALATVRLAGYEDRMATQLSGGQQQRLALARAIVRRPRLLLLDEPLSNLDAKLREAMRAELAALQRRLGVTTLYVTHDQADALSMSDRIAVMDAGRIVQEGAPRDIYQRPRSRFVADFVGTMNVMEGTVRGHDGGLVRLDCDAIELVASTDAAGAAGTAVIVAIRPEDVRLHRTAPADATNVIAGRIGQLMFLGDHVDCHVRAGDRTFIVRQGPGGLSTPGDEVWLELPSSSLTVMEVEA